MERITETGGINPYYINKADFDNQKEGQEKSALNEPAAYTEISTTAVSLSKEIDKTKLLELLGPSVSEKYTDLLVSISKNSNRTENFIHKVNPKIDLYA